MSPFFIDRGISYGQYANCLLAIHIGGTVLGVNAPGWLRKRGCYAARLELFTNCQRLRFRPFSLDKRRPAA